MGLSEKDFEEETKGLHMMGIPTEPKSVDEQIDEYFYTKKKTDTAKKAITVLKKVEDGKKILEISTSGFKDGVLQHNMPCPVCLSEPAVYVSNEDGTYFSPCKTCESEGFELKKKKKKTGFWNG